MRPTCFTTNGYGIFNVRTIWAHAVHTKRGRKTVSHPAPPRDRTQGLRISIPTLQPLSYVPRLTTNIKLKSCGNEVTLSVGNRKICSVNNARSCHRKMVELESKYRFCLYSRFGGLCGSFACSYVLFNECIDVFIDLFCILCIFPLVYLVLH